MNNLDNKIVFDTTAQLKKVLFETLINFGDALNSLEKKASQFEKEINQMKTKIVLYLNQFEKVEKDNNE